MDTPPETASSFEDRSLGLVIFGVISVLIGVCCALLIPLNLVAVGLAGPAGAVVDTPSALSASALYGVIAGAFVWLGIGSIRARRWACELMLSLSWIWLLTGVCSLALGIVVVPKLVREIAISSGLPADVATLLILVIFGVIAFIYVVLPGAFVLFYRSPQVAATCRARDPRPQWIDRCPRRLLTLTVVWALAAASVLLAPAYGFFFPFFGVVVTGAAGAALWAVVLASCIALAVGTSRKAQWAWRFGMALTVAASLSSVLTVIRYDLTELIALMALPEEQGAMLAALAIGGRWPVVVATALVWGTFVVYLATLRGSFGLSSAAADD